jgi:hypothetical protein
MADRATGFDSTVDSHRPRQPVAQSGNATSTEGLWTYAAPPKAHLALADGVADGVADAVADAVGWLR